MGETMMEKGYLILENGAVLEGVRFGADAEAAGELVFTTAMTGYLETLTDPSYFGQMVVQTFPLIGNYGVIPADFESRRPVLSAYIVRQWCREPSNFRSEGDLDTFFSDIGISGLCGVDTRKLTRMIREAGVMNARLTSRLPGDIRAAAAALADMRVRGGVEAVTCKEAEFFGLPTAKRRVILWDFGAKRNIRRELLRRDCEVLQVPADTTAGEILAARPDGVMLSNGPGDPADNTEIIGQLARLCATGIPLFGICLGHQLLALARGAKTGKLKYGHRGANHPVRDCAAGRVAITSQNHGYAVLTDTLPTGAVQSFENVNDHTCEGIDYLDMPAFSVQFHPEACAGPRDTAYLFDRFVELMDRVKSEREAGVCR